MAEKFWQIAVDFHFLRPWILGLLILPLFYYWRFYQQDTVLSSWEKVVDKKLLPFLLIKGGNQKRRLSVLILAAGMVTAILAAAGPAFIKSELPAVTTETPVMILLNLSSDMKQTDMAPNRLTRAKIEIKYLLEQSQDIESGLIVYTDEPFLISPLSGDSQLVINLLPAIGFDIMPVNGDRLDRAIDLAVEKIAAAGFSYGDIVIFSAESGVNFAKTAAAAQRAQEKGITVNIVNMSKSRNPSLIQIAKAGGGLAVDGDNGNAKHELGKASLGALINTINRKAKNENWRISKNLLPEWQDAGWYLLWLPMLCCLYFFRKGFVLILFLITVSPSAQAAFFINDNQQGMQFYNQGDYMRAAHTFKNQQWQGTALYRAGDYEGAAKAFAGTDDAESLYNQANALAKAGKIEEAIKNYERVLQLQPKHEDAKFNLEYLKQQQKQNPPSSSQNNDQQQSNQPQKNQNQSQSGGGEQNKNQQSQPDSSNQEQNPRQQPESSAGHSDKTEQPQNNPKDSSQNQPQAQQNKSAESVEEQKQPIAPAREGKTDQQYDEQAQARVQQFREIPEDPGGLLRSFIVKEYHKKRYGD